MNDRISASAASSLLLPDEGMSLHEFFDILRRGWRLLTTITLCTTLVAAIAAWAFPKQYVAKVLLSPVTNQSGSGGLGGVSSALSQLGGLASLAGISAPGGGGDKEDAVATLQSEALTEKYIREHNLLPILFKSRWDSERQTWKISDPGTIPTLWKGNEYFARHVREVNDTARSGLITLTITWTDPRLAAEWANGLVSLTNNDLREKAIRETDRNIAYLNDQASKTTIVETRNAIYSLLETEIKKQMIARGSDEYAFKVIDPAVVAERAASPQKVLWISLGFLFGLLLSLGILMATATSNTLERHRAPVPHQ